MAEKKKTNRTKSARRAKKSKGEAAKRSKKEASKRSSTVVDTIASDEESLPVDLVEDSPIEPAEAEPLPVKASGRDLVHLEPLQRYLMEIRDHEILDRETEKQLAIKWREEGDIEAAQRLVGANLRLVVKIALEYRHYWMNLLDLIQEGNVGLMQAVKNYDPYKNVKLSSYASFWIKAYILKFIIDNWSLVKIGTTQAQRKLFFNLRKEQERLSKMGIEPTVEQLAHSLQVNESDVVEMTQRMAHSGEVSLDAPISDDGEDSHIDFLSDKEDAMDVQLAEKEIQEIFKEKLMEFRKQLSGKELFIFDNRMLADDPMTLQEIGDHFNVTRERIRQIETRLMKKLREFIFKEIPELKDFEVLPRKD